MCLCIADAIATAFDPCNIMLLLLSFDAWLPIAMYASAIQYIPLQWGLGPSAGPGRGAAQKTAMVHHRPRGAWGHPRSLGGAARTLMGQRCPVGPEARSEGLEEGMERGRDMPWEEEKEE